MLTLMTVLAQSPAQGTVALGFSPPDVTQVLTFFIKAFFIIAGLVALVYLLLGAFAWITSGGNKDNVTKARDQIQAAVIGLVLVFAVLAVVVLLENVLNIGLGISTPISFPKLIQPNQ